MEDDINVVNDYFSYEHFYVLYCKFWELDSDHDFLLTREDLNRMTDLTQTVLGTWKSPHINLLILNGIMIMISSVVQTAFSRKQEDHSSVDSLGKWVTKISFASSSAKKIKRQRLHCDIGLM